MAQPYNFCVRSEMVMRYETVSFLTQIRLLLHLRSYYLLLLVVWLFLLFSLIELCAHKRIIIFISHLWQLWCFFLIKRKHQTINEKNERSQINHKKVIYIRFFCLTTLIHLCGAMFFRLLHWITGELQCWVNVIPISLRFYDRLRLPFNRFNAHFTCSSSKFYFLPETMIFGVWIKICSTSICSSLKVLEWRLFFLFEN